MSTGTLQNGEARLLYSSAQIDYIRLWLVKTGLTKEMIPLPYKACMLTSSNLQNWAPVIYKTAADLKKAHKVRTYLLAPQPASSMIPTAD